MGWWITLAVLVALAVLPLGVRVRYNAAGIYLAVIAGPLRIRILPAKKKDPDKKKKPKKDKKPKKEKKKPAKEKDPSPTPAPEAPAPRPEPAAGMTPQEKYPGLEKTPGKVPPPRKPRLPAEEKPEAGGSWTDFLSLVPVVLDFLGDFVRKLRVNRLELKLVLAGDDPCDLAVNYGRAWTALGNLLPRLERFLVIQKRDLEVECDFTASETTVIAGLDLTITLGRILACVCKFAFHALVEYLKIMKKRKGGAVK